MKKEKILLITDVPPCESLSGASMTLQQIKMLLEEKYEVGIFLVQSKDLPNSIDANIVDKIQYKKVDKPNECWTGMSNSKYNKEFNQIKNELSKFINKNSFTLVWGIIQGQTMVDLLKFVQDELQMPFVCQIWDSIKWWMNANKYSKDRYQKVLKDYYDLIKNSKACITASENMSEFFKKTIKNKYYALYPYLETHDLKLQKIVKKDNVINISMVGQVYAKDELDSFLSALDKLHWKIKGKKIYFHHYGNFSESYIDFKKHGAYFDRIIIHGFVEQKSLIHILKNSDFLYMPYFFTQEDAYMEVAKTSFPCKYITYLAVKKPVIIHAPEYSSPSKFAKKYNCSFIVDSIDVDYIANKLLELCESNNSYVENSIKAFEENFTKKIIKEKFFKALGLKISNTLKILEINNIDLSGKRFNGYDLLHYINENTKYTAKQMVTYKESNCVDVHKYYEKVEHLYYEYRLLEAELNILGVHNILSFTTNIIKHSNYFKEADFIHYHLVDNTKLSLVQLPDLFNLKPSVVTLHDPWWFTGHCVYPQECEGWKKGCQNCPHLDYLFALPKDNCHSLWKLKKDVYSKIKSSVIVSTPFMVSMINDCPLTQKSFKNPYVIPFGIDLKSFDSKISQDEAKKYFKIPKDNIVIFLRAQDANKGTEYVYEAMDLLETDKKITLLTCSEVGLLNGLKGKYNIIDLGNIQDDVMQKAYKACDMFLMPSKGETFGLMAIECMASSRPIIVFNNTALPYVTFAPECGVLVENKNSEELMKAIKFLLDNPKERIKRGKLGRELAEKHYNVDLYNKKMLETYIEVYNSNKNNKVSKIDDIIDYDDENVKQLIVKLKKVYKRIGFNTELKSKSFIMKNTIKEDDNFIIDYSNINVQKLIREFNNYIYDVYDLEVLHNLNEDSTLIKRHTFTFIYKLKNNYYDRLKKHPKLFNVVRFFYRGTRRTVQYFRYEAFK